MLAPMSDDPVRTRVRTRRGELEFQTYFVKRRAQDAVLAVRFEGAARARPAPRVLEAIRDAAAIILCPSNPIISIGPILAVPGIRAALRRARAPVAAISPIVGGRALKGPADRMMKSMGLQASAAQVAKLYRDFLDVFVLDREDENQSAAIAALGLRAVVTNTIMSDVRAKKSLARAVLEAL
ncbi:MAG TPA: 2-phospho-L-lactate transferase CofD family protein, partial [Bryobacterales bacterium]|nr:2-phospho-L-lactate transferase CofD family protein [Bryobacterales bacterium]